jgi:hypothetical protein
MLIVKMKGILKGAAVLSFFMKVYSIPLHDRGHINVMLVLQNCTDSLQFLPGSSGKTFPTSSDGTNDVNNTGVEEDVVLMKAGFLAINEKAAVRIKQEEIPGDITFPDIKAEPHDVSYVCVCILLDTFHQCPEMSVVFVMPIFLASSTSYTVQNETVLL